MTKRTPPTNPTGAQWDSYQRAFAYFNQKLFGGELPTPILNFSRKSARTMGFFAPQRWEVLDARGRVRKSSEQAKVHEISLNPETLAYRTREEVASTLVHEMCHLWRQEQDPPPRGGYHDRRWAEKMDEVGLAPSHTGLPGGRRTGQQVTHYVEPDGEFARAFRAMPKDCLLPFASNPELRKKAKKRNKVKYTCPGCSANVWGKPEMEIKCEACEETFEAEEADDV